jgi:hypothetical protein
MPLAVWMRREKVRPIELPRIDRRNLGMETPSDDWSLKEFHPKGTLERWFFRKNLAPNIDVGHPEYHYLAYLTFTYQPKDSSGLPNKEDNDSLYRIEESELEPLIRDALAIHVASVMKSGIKDLLFYTRDPKLFKSRSEWFLRTYPQFQIQCEISADPKWSQYSDFP